jgi:hypothetical protein
MSRRVLLSAFCLFVASALVTFFWLAGGIWQESANGERLTIAQARAAIHEATPSGVRLDSKILGVSVEPDVVKNRIVEFVSKLALK